MMENEDLHRTFLACRMLYCDKSFNWSSDTEFGNFSKPRYELVEEILALRARNERRTPEERAAIDVGEH
jgi:hypothetical protein